MIRSVPSETEKYKKKYLKIKRRRRPLFGPKYIHSKNAFKTVLARSGAEINGFLCFGYITLTFLRLLNIGKGKRRAEGSREGKEEKKKPNITKRNYFTVRP
jgi:hypothetical protein